MPSSMCIGKVVGEDRDAATASLMRGDAAQIICTAAHAASIVCQ